MRRLGIIRGDRLNIARRSILFVSITWLPMLVFAAWTGRAIGPSPRMSMLLDFSNYARLFVAAPLLFMAESIIAPRLRVAALYFLDADVVARSDRSAFLAAAIRAKRRRDSIWPEILILGIAVLGTWFLTIEQLSGAPIITWHTMWVPPHGHLILPGLWFNFVAIPMVQFFFFRWLWWIAVWIIFLSDVSRLDLNLLPTHADAAGGLGFLSAAQVSFAILPFAMSCVISADFAFRITFENLDLAALRTMILPLIAYLVITEMVIFGPLLLFVPPLIKAKLNGLITYGTLTQKHNQLFHDKWISAAEPECRSPLGNQDMSSLIDLGSSYKVVEQMSVVPVNARQVIGVAVITCMPGLPLIVLLVPMSEIVQLFLTVIV